MRFATCVLSKLPRVHVDVAWRKVQALHRSGDRPGTHPPCPPFLGLSVVFLHVRAHLAAWQLRRQPRSCGGAFAHIRVPRRGRVGPAHSARSQATACHALRASIRSRQSAGGRGRVHPPVGRGQLRRHAERGRTRGPSVAKAQQLVQPCPSADAPHHPAPPTRTPPAPRPDPEPTCCRWHHRPAAERSARDCPGTAGRSTADAAYNHQPHSCVRHGSERSPNAP